MDGEALGCKIRADKDLQDTVLVLLTSRGQKGDAKRFEACGFDAYLTKPLQLAPLKSILAVALGAKNKGSPLALMTKYTVAESEGKGIVPRELNQDHVTRVLLAEDNAINQKVTTKMLQKLGCCVEVAADGKEAINMLERSDYDLIFMDCQMPEMDGYEATEEIRQRENDKKHTPIIALTATAMKEDRERCLQVGMDDYLTKPVNLKALQKTLLRWSPPDDEVINIPIR